MRVKAIKLGYYGGMLRTPGTEFLILDDKQFSKIWMEKVLDDTPKTAAPEPIADETLPERKGPGRPRKEV